MLSNCFWRYAIHSMIILHHKLLDKLYTNSSEHFYCSKIWSMLGRRPFSHHVHANSTHEKCSLLIALQFLISFQVLVVLVWSPQLNKASSCSPLTNTLFVFLSELQCFIFLADISCFMLFWLALAHHSVESMRTSLGRCAFYGFAYNAGEKIEIYCSHLLLVVRLL